MGPKLSATRRMRTRTAAQIKTIITQGLTTSGMPAFKLPAAEVEALTAYVRSLNLTAAESKLPGSVDAGRDFFFGKGQCANCHMVRGLGKAVGPDLSGVARELTVGEIRQVLREPASRVTPGYELVTVKGRDGKSTQGFKRSQTNFDLTLQTLDGKFAHFSQAEIAAIVPAKQPFMPALKASAEETRDLLAYLGSLGRLTESTYTLGKSAPVGQGIDFARIANPKPGDWLSYNGNLSGNRYSPLKQIDTTNVRRLGVKWMFPIDHFGLEVTPLVADGVMYITGPNQAIALDAVSGRQLWKYSRPRTQGLIGDASLGTNRGAAILGDKVFMAMDNAHLIALNRVTGALVWDVYMPLEAMKYGSTVAPLAVKDMIVCGVSGGDRGIRGFLVAYKADTGEQVWRHWTIPRKGEEGSETWGGFDPVAGGGATWLTGAFDVADNTIYWPTGNPWPDSDDKERPGDNLYSNCILALDPDTGKMKWYYQFTPHDTHDWDATEPPLLVDTTYQGKPAKLLLHTDRNGFFYVLDRTTHKPILTKAFSQQTWTQGIGPDGRPLPPPADLTPLDCPQDAANWNSSAFSPVTRLTYVLTLDVCRARRGGTWKTEPVVPPAQKLLRAIHIDSGNIAWQIPFEGAVAPKTWPGVFATAGGLVFFSDPNGTFAAADEKNGKVLWSFPTNVYMKASPMTYAVGGKQYVATVAGPNIMVFSLP